MMLLKMLCEKITFSDWYLISTCVFIWWKHKILFHTWKFFSVLGLNLDPESDPDLHSSKSLDLHIMNADPKHCFTTQTSDCSTMFDFLLRTWYCNGYEDPKELKTTVVQSRYSVVDRVRYNVEVFWALPVSPQGCPGRCWSADCWWWTATLSTPHTKTIILVCEKTMLFSSWKITRLTEIYNTFKALLLSS
jgi:hypothetical protein